MAGLHILITGGAGFIGSHLADELLAFGHSVRALDCLTPQVHGEDRKRPAYLAPEVDLVLGDVRDASAVDRALEGIDAVVHFAAAVGVGQSMYDVEHYTSVNTGGTAALTERLMKHRVARLVVASSMSVYGEGLYEDASGTIRHAAGRDVDQLRRHEWNPTDDHGRALTPRPTPESKVVTLESIYALSKYYQERACLLFGRAYGVPTVALRFFNVFGTRQALSNPYTGVLAIFASRLMHERRPMVFEDGLQQRDFVHVSDVARACRLAIETDRAIGEAVNIGSGQPRTILDVARAMAEAVGKPSIAPEITGKYRVGDVRHCFADIGQARRLLGYEPRVGFDEGLRELADWLATQEAARDRVAEARAELEQRGLTL